MTYEIHIGDRVRVTEKASLGFTQPWRTRFKKGLTGTVVGADSRGNHVQWDVPKRVRHKGELFMRGIQDQELEHAPEADQ